jgi:16S rRNA (adenine1518-N6/adenine1519-N6)-dimethyltransferase
MKAPEVKAELAALGVRAEKSRGQNFLVDDSVSAKEIDLLAAKPSDMVLEVGPGLGVLTLPLLARGLDLTAIEIEDRFADRLTAMAPQLKVIKGDALEVPWPPFTHFISNLPYSISSPLLFKLLDHDFERAVVMVQKEFADRMAGKAGSDDYSRLSVGVYYRAECKVVAKVGRSHFWPEPDVDSSIVLLQRRPAPFTVKDERLFFKLVDALFAQRRKKIRTTLRSRHLLQDESSVPYLDERVEDLTPEQIGELADAVHVQRR